MTKRLAILHRGTAIKSYFISVLAREWKAAGWSIVTVNDPRRFVDADVAISHIDSTQIPQEWQRLLACYPRVVNRALDDISKRRITAGTLTNLEGWEGPVIVKTDANCGGGPEIDARASRLALGIRPAARALGYAMRKLRRARGVDPGGAYPVFERLADVPDRLRRDRRLVVQKFLPERDGDRYVLRFTTFFGDRAMTVRSVSNERIVKAANAIESQIVETPPGVLERMRAFGADYAKVDFVMVDGEPVILDLNRTPSFRGPEPNPRHLELARLLAPELEKWVVTPAQTVAR